MIIKQHIIVLGTKFLRFNFVLRRRNEAVATREIKREKRKNRSSDKFYITTHLKGAIPQRSLAPWSHQQVLEAIRDSDLMVQWDLLPFAGTKCFALLACMFLRTTLLFSLQIQLLLDLKMHPQSFLQPQIWKNNKIENPGDNLEQGRDERRSKIYNHDKLPFY